MIVAVSIFATASVVVADLFLIANRTQRRTSADQQIQSDARVIFAQLTDRIRSGEIDYDGYGGTAPLVGDTLRVIDERGNFLVVRKSDTVFSNTVCPTAASTPCLEISNDGGTTFQPLTSQNVKVNAAQFFIDPPQSPLNSSGTGFDYNIQPRVTISVGLQSTAPGVSQATTFIQTSVSSRVLLR